MTSVNQDFIIWAGDNKEIHYSLTLPSGTDLTGSTATWALSASPTTSGIVVKSSDNSGQITVDDMDDQVIVFLEPADTEGLANNGMTDYYCELQVELDDSSTYTAAVGTCRVRPTIIPDLI